MSHSDLDEMITKNKKSRGPNVKKYEHLWSFLYYTPQFPLILTISTEALSNIDSRTYKRALLIIFSMKHFAINLFHFSQKLIQINLFSLLTHPNWKLRKKHEYHMIIGKGLKETILF